MSSPTIVTCRGVSKRFGGLLANDGIDLTIARGEILGLIGPNGAGKSTLFNLIAGAFPVSSGTIMLGDREITALSAQQRCKLGVARTYQVPRSFESMTVIENVTVGAFVRQRRVSAALEKAYRTLEYVGLVEHATVAAADLSPPLKRRLEIARALATEPTLLLLDEVLTGLTPSEARAGVELIRTIRDSGVTIVMVEHVMEIVMPLVDRAVVLNLGKVLAEGKPKDVVRDESVITAYLGDRHRAA
ncbi:MAG TPA: ABC transporter ATP-binding protein [Bradyrhizobium sp.]|uniref:ABC transporter ATP-binding protein n=1 Tax=Bradyrhizobium sp. TaxID=376 RepID=UPI002CD53DCB|nr:ABC transporter ATP-binding protein [Bradyrhizobium sp.]HLZ03116.1 ABC transporter ATP-binding protein [Bradyrhizobium sp.]